MKKFLAALLVSTSVFAAAPVNDVVSTDDAFALNTQMGPAALQRSLGTQLLHSHTTAYGVLDCSKQACAIGGTYNVGILLPAKAILRQVVFNTVTAVAPSSVSVAWQLLSANDIKTATAASSWTGITAGIQTGAVANMLKTTTATQVQAVISGSTATAGKIKVFADYVISE